jgi:predicted Zn-ribbon and HTH transcriptional regulator
MPGGQVSDDRFAEVDADDHPARRLGELPGLRDALQAVVDQHLALPSHRCRSCGAQFRHKYPGTCYDCDHKRYAADRGRE